METITEVNQKKCYYGKLGELYVRDVYCSSGNVDFTSDYENAEKGLDRREVEWLRKNVPGIKIMRCIITVEEIEADDEELIVY